MPSYPLDRERHRTVSEFAVVGSYLPAEQPPNCVRHAALLRAETRLRRGDEAEVWHMKPPLVAGHSTLQQAARRGWDRCVVDAVGETELDSSQRAGMATWRADADKERRPPELIGQYVAHPPVDEVPDDVTGRVRYRKFSCAGFVLECYRHGAGMDLIDWRSDPIPVVDMPFVVSIYGSVAQSRRDDIGLGREDSWPIVFPGYLFHALNRSPDEIHSGPYIPASIQEVSFP